MPETCGRFVVIGGVGGLSQTVVSETRFVHPVRIGNIGPVGARDLRTCVNESEPLRLELKGVVHRSGIVAEEIARADSAAIVEVIINFCDGVVGANGVWEAGDKRIGLRVVEREPFSIARYRRAENAARDVQADLAGRHAVGDQIGNCIGNAAAGAEAGIGGGNVHDRRIADRVALAFIAAEEKQFILNHRTAGRAAKLFECARCFGGAGDVENVAGIKRGIAAESVSAAVERVGARFQGYIYDRARFPAVLRRGIFDQIEFLNGVDGEDCRGIAGDAGAVDDALSRKWLAIEKAVDEVGVVLGAQTVGAGGGKSAAGIAHNAGAQLQQIFVVSAVQRQIRDFFVAKRAAKDG